MKNFCIKLVKKDYHYVRMHGQQNIKIYNSIFLIINRYSVTSIVKLQDTVRYGTVSVLMNHLHTWPHLQQTRLPCLSLSGEKKKNNNKQN